MSPDGEHAAGPRGARLLLILVVVEGGGAHPQVHQPGLAGRHVVALGIQHPHLGARPRSADRSGPLQPLPRGDDGPAALAGRVVLDHHRPPPVQHPALDVLRAGRGAVDRGPQRCHVVAVAGLVRQREQPAELGGHHVRVGHPVPLGQGEHLLRLEAVHQHDRVAELERDRREVQHRGVVERRAAQVHVVVEGRERENPEEPGGGPGRLVRVLAGQRAAHALGPARRARGVHHRGTRRPRVRAAGTVRAERGQRREPRHRAHGEPGPGIDPGRLGCLRRNAGEPLVGHERRGTAVAQDVGHLGGGQVPVHRHDVQPGLRRREEKRECLGAVGQHPGHGGAGAEPERLQAPSVPVGQRGQFRVADGLAVRVDHRGQVGVSPGNGPQADVSHAPNLEHVLGTDKAPSG